MALNFASMLLQPTKTSAWDLSPGGGSAARENLKLMRERFEFEKKQAAEEKEQNELELRAKQAQQAALAEKERLDREAETQSKLLAKRQEAALKYSEAINSGQPDQVEALVPYLESLGSGVDITRGAGLPSFRFHMDAEADRNKGWETATRPVDAGAYDEAPPPLAPAPTPGETGTVTDMQAMADDRLSRIGPAFRSIVEAHPEAYQDAATSAAVGVGQMNLPAEKALTELRMQLGGPIELIKAQLQSNAQKEQFEDKKALTPMEQSTLRSRGENSAQTLAKEMDVTGAATAITVGDEVLDLIEDGLPENDTMIAGALLSLQDVKGIPSDKDLAMAFGMDKASTITQVLDFIGTKVKGGFQPEQREAIQSFVKRVTETQRQKAFDYLDSVGKVGDLDENERRGYLGGVERAVPGWLRAEYEEDRAARKGKKGAGSDKGAMHEPNPIQGGSDFDIELESQAMENDLDPDKLAPIIRGESGGKAGAVSTEGARGVMQIMPDNLRAMGIDPEAYGKLSAVEQLPAVFQFLKDQGITADSTAEEYVMAVAASDPKYRNAPDDTVVYPKGSPAWKANAPWRPADGGDITRGSILAYYGLREKGSKGEAPKAELPAPVTAAEKRLRELMDREKR